MLKFIQDWYRRRQDILYLNDRIRIAQRQADYWEAEANKWRHKYENAQKYIDDLKNDIFSYEDYP